MQRDSKILVTGARGMVGSAIVRKLRFEGYRNIFNPSRQDLPLDNQDKLHKWMTANRPQYVIHAAGKVGGIYANSIYPAEFGYQNNIQALNVIESSRLTGVSKLLYLGSSCIYPRNCEQPIKEDYLLSSRLEKTNEMYALAKIMGIKLCDAYREQYGCNFISCMPCNLYGPNDNFHPENSHVIPALIRRFHEAKINGVETVTCWGDGSPMREFLYVEDLADACLFLMNNYNRAGHINVGTGNDVKLKKLAKQVSKIIGFEGKIKWDTSKPNGTPRKVMDISQINDLGWSADTDLETGLEKSYKWFIDHVDMFRG